MTRNSHYTCALRERYPGNKISFRGIYFLWVTLYYSVEEMADMDELFGSDGDSDNDQRGIFLLSIRYGLFLKLAAGLSRRFLANVIHFSIAIGIIRKTSVS